jgi:glycosyltransferase involved in cell wall biosynthesis
MKPDVVLVYNRDWAFLARGLMGQQRTIFHVQALSTPSRTTRWVHASIDRAISGYIASSSYVAAQLGELGIPRERIVVVPNGIADVPTLETPPKRGICTIGLPGQVGAWKGHDDFIAALAILRSTGQQFTAAIFGVGEQSYVNSLKRAIDTGGMSEQVTWHGYIRDADEMYRCMDVCVMPSRIDEAFGLVAAEAGLRGVPVVATRRGALPEIIADGETGFLVESHNPAQLAEKLKLLLHDESLRRQLGAKARERCRMMFTGARMLDEVERACSMVASARLGSPQVATV